MKIKSIFMFFILFPVIAFILNGFLAGKDFDWSLENVNKVTIITNIIIATSAVIILFKNYRKSSNLKWYVIGAISLVFALVNLILVNVISNFGF
ncbi:MAG: hypothetical protein KW804_01505 [Candidatus Doudnabacteria bacterium]|nr:hypothetical protein [Candidatus Doudnabacteria bacterium]